MKIEDIVVGETYLCNALRAPVECTGKGRRMVLVWEGMREISRVPDDLSPLPPPAPPKAKVRLLGIVWSASWKGANVYRLANGDHNRLGNAPEEPGFVGYLMPDGRISRTPTVMVMPDGDYHIAASMDAWESGDARLMRATHVVCLEVAP